MRVEIHEAVWLDERQQFSLAELAELSGLPEAEVRQLIDYAALAPAEVDAAEAKFGADCLVTARMACRLRNDFDLDAGGLALTLTLVDRIRAPGRAIAPLHAQFPQRHK